MVEVAPYWNVNTNELTIFFLTVNDNITMNRKWKIKMYKNDH